MPPLPPPKVAVTPTCTQCGSATYCGGPKCPSSTLQLAPDGVPMNNQTFVSVPQLQHVSTNQQGEQKTYLGVAAG